MKQLSGVLVFLSLLFDFSSGQAIYCQSASTFQITIGPVISCPTGYICDASSNSPCVLDSSTTTTSACATTTTLAPTTTTPAPTTTTPAPTTTTPAPTTTTPAPTTTTPAPTTTTPAPTTTTTTTSVASTTTSVPTSTSAPITTTVLTTTAPTTTACPEGQTGTEPSCTSAGTTYPGPTCDQYYECYSILWFWYGSKLRTCESGLTYSSSQGECVSTQGSCACVD